MNFCVIVSGLPASGKTTLGKNIAQRLEWAFLDKDDFLEALFDTSTVETSTQRAALSRQSDLHFIQAAKGSVSAVLVSHWQSLQSVSESGTPSQWISKHYGRVIEIHCVCEQAVAEHRFMNRKRHPSHLDQHLSLHELSAKMTAWARRFPLRIGTLIEVDTAQPPELDRIVQDIQVLTSGHISNA